MPALRYEYLIRKAFGHAKNNGPMLDRSKDPAGLANADIYNSNSQASKMKAAIIYSMEIFIYDIENHNKVTDDLEFARLDNFANRVMDAADKVAVLSIIDDFYNSVLHVYYVGNDGVMTLI